MHTPSGFMLVDKPAGMTSFGVVARVRRLLSERAGKKVKVGHTGTLDPFATGLMLIVVGDYCKRAGEFSKLDKGYEATIRLGEVSTTGDPEGDIEPASDKQPAEEDIQAVLHTFRGPIIQRPPMYSAIKIDGQRAYKLAREGKQVEIPERTITVRHLEMMQYTYPDLQVRCHVSSGTYIRTLAEDIGKALGTGAYTTALRRTSVGKYHIGEAERLDAISLQELRTDTS